MSRPCFWVNISVVHYDKNFCRTPAKNVMISASIAYRHNYIAAEPGVWLNVKPPIVLSVEDYIRS